jgi:hypothetical protein
MPENIGSAGAPYNTKIPRIDENADIQTALRLYHYGDNTTNPGSIINDSIAGHLQQLEDSKVSKAPSVIGASQNLDTYVETGYFNQESTTNARSGSNYPSYPDPTGTGRFYAGLLKVVNDGGIVYQEYHMYGEPSYVVNTVFWRIRYANAWTTWQGLVNEDDILAITDNNYHRKSVTYTRVEMDARYSPRLFTENAKTANHTLSLDDINKIVSMNVSGEGTVTVPDNATVAIPVGSVINIYNQSASNLTVAPAAGVTVRNAGFLEQYKEGSLRKRATNEWVAAGPLY